MDWIKGYMVRVVTWYNMVKLTITKFFRYGNPWLGDFNDEIKRSQVLDRAATWNPASSRGYAGNRTSSGRMHIAQL